MMQFISFGIFVLLIIAVSCHSNVAQPLVPHTRQTTNYVFATFMLGKNGLERRLKRHAAAVLFKVTVECVDTSVASSEPTKPRDGTDIQCKQWLQLVLP